MSYSRIKNKPDALWAVKKKKSSFGQKKHKKNACVLVCVGVCSWRRVVACVCVYVCVGLDVFHVLLVCDASSQAASGVPGPLACVLLAAVCLSCQYHPVSMSCAPNLVSVEHPPGCSPSRRLFLDCLLHWPDGSGSDDSMLCCAPGYICFNWC